MHNRGFCSGCGPVRSHGLPLSYGAGERVNLIDALYIAVITASTVGYGDFSPQSDWCKIAFLFCPGSPERLS